MAANKPEILIFLLLDQIETRFRRLRLFFDSMVRTGRGQAPAGGVYSQICLRGLIIACDNDDDDEMTCTPL